MKKVLFLFVFVFLFLFLFLPNAGFSVYAFFPDEEIDTENDFSAGSLDITTSDTPDPFNPLIHEQVIITINNIGTVEVDPAYGKYHWDGHRNCGFSCSPQETEKLNGVCPKCGKQLLVGVESRVEELATIENPVVDKN